MSKPIKQVLVLDFQHQADGFMAAQRLQKDHDGTDHAAHPDADSRQQGQVRPIQWRGNKSDPGAEAPTKLVPGELEQQAIIRHPALLTEDETIQFYCFRNVLPYPHRDAGEAAKEGGPNYLNYWVRRMEDQFKSGEKLDAIVVPTGLPAAIAEQVESFLIEIQNRWRDIKIIRTEPHRADSANSFRSQIGLEPLPERDTQLEENADAARIEETWDRNADKYLEGPRYQGLRDTQADKESAVRAAKDQLFEFYDNLSELTRAEGRQLLTDPHRAGRIADLFDENASLTRNGLLLSGQEGIQEYFLHRYPCAGKVEVLTMKAYGRPSYGEVSVDVTARLNGQMHQAEGPANPRRIKRSQEVSLNVTDRWLFRDGKVISCESDTRRTVPPKGTGWVGQGKN
jgi:hypothetical protein